MTDPAFPANIVDTLVGAPAGADPATGLWAVDGVKTIEKNSLEATSANGSVGVVAQNWAPIDWEIGAGDTRGRYFVIIQTMTKHARRDEGAAISSKLAKVIRLTVARDPALQVALAGQSETILGVTERLLLWRVQTQRYHDAKISGAFAFASVTQCYFDTEIF